MKARRRVLLVSACVVLFVAAVIVVVMLHKRAAPEPARLLPEAEVAAYIDFAAIRTLTGLDKKPLPGLAPGYDEFVRETGFAFERDLHEVAMAVHRGREGGESRYSEVVVGRYDQSKLAGYLKKQAKSVESYRETDVYSIPVEDRTVRVVMLAVDTVAISNVTSPSVIHGIIDRFHKAALPFGGPRLVRTYYRKVPVGSLLWAVAQLGGDGEAPSITLPAGVTLSPPTDSDVVFSVRPLTKIEARADFYSHNKEALRDFAAQMEALLELVRSLQENAQNEDPDVKALLNSLQVTQQQDHAELQATIPPGLLRKLVTDPIEAAAEEGALEDEAAED